tara:strand:+ start:689 stop:880 length:192 start_codon:yes stop_codon:yes gene_type:complete
MLAHKYYLENDEITANFRVSYFLGIERRNLCEMEHVLMEKIDKMYISEYEYNTQVFFLRRNNK